MRNYKKLRMFVEQYTRKLINEAKSKQTVIRQFYKFVHSFTTHRFRDDAWQNVHMVLDEIGEWADDLNVWVENGGYGSSADGFSKYKDWQFELIKDGFKVRGYLRANACGNTDNPFGVYDVTIIVW